MYAIVRAVWSSKMPLANAPAILNLLDGPVDVDPAFYVVWSRFRMMRRYLAYCPEEEPRVFRMLDLISRGAQGQVLSIFFISLLLRLVLPGTVMRRVGSGFPTSLAHDGLSYSAFASCHSGGLAFSCLFQTF